jgi:hypothetical protein
MSCLIRTADSLYQFLFVSDSTPISMADQIGRDCASRDDSPGVATNQSNENNNTDHNEKLDWPNYLVATIVAQRALAIVSISTCGGGRAVCARACFSYRRRRRRREIHVELEARGARLACIKD